MVDQDVPRYAALLKSQYLFAGLDEAQLAHVVNCCQRVTAGPGEVIIRQGAEGDSFFIIFSGRVRVTRRDGQSERSLNVMGPGEYFGEEALLFDRPRSATITAVDPVVLLRLDRDDFIAIVQAYPDVRMNLSATAESRHIAHRERFDWLEEEEIIYLIARKHELFLYTALIIPALVLIAGIPVLMFAAASTSSFVVNAGYIGGGVMVLGGILWGVWNWLDWGNDFYIVTSQRVILLERVIILYYSRRESSLSQVLSVSTRSSFWGRVFKYGDVQVKTFTGEIMMRRCPEPAKFAKFVEGYQSRVKQVQSREKQQGIEREVDYITGRGPNPFDTGKPGGKPAGADRKRNVKPGSLRDKIDTFLQMRYERGGVITYRKHLLVLLAKTWLPIATFLLIVGATAMLVWPREGGPVLGAGPLLVLLAVVYLANFLWWGYNYWDWSDDIYQLTADQVLDIERKPLGEEIKKSASLDSIQSIEHTREGLIQLIFNYGNVIINVGKDTFIFKGVNNPDQVQKDVAEYTEKRRYQKIQKEESTSNIRIDERMLAYHRRLRTEQEAENDPDWDIFPG